MLRDGEVKIGNLLEAAGCELNGSDPWDPQINDSSVYERIVHGGTLAAAETYMDGLWDCEQLDVLSERVGGLNSPIKHLGKLTVARTVLSGLLRNMQSINRAQRNAEHHYNIGNELYEEMLGETMAYSCAYWKNGAETLDEAQGAKFDLICRKLGLESGMRVLDIGSGWGGLLKHAVEVYGVEGVGITPASEQVAYVKQNGYGFEVRQSDWREIEHETFDRVVSVGMFEHVGPKNYRGYFEKVRSLLKTGGLSLLHTIGAPRTRYFADPWIRKYIFPGGHIPSKKQITRASEPDFEIADWHEMGLDYDPTLMAWNENFQAAWPRLRQIEDGDGKPRYDERFKRMWEYYLLTCAGSFRNGANQLFQIVLSDPGEQGSYTPVR